jgi:bacterioferritin-associated ferredoxin
MAGNGPLLLLLACHLLEQGVNIAAWLDTGSWSKRILSVGVMPAALLDLPYMGKGLKMALKIVKGKIPMIVGVDNLRAEGEGALDRVRFTVRGQEREIAAKMLLRHEGIIPRTHIANSVDIAHRWNALQRCWHPMTDENGATNVDGVYIAGDGAYVHGGDVSMDKGVLAGIASARYLGLISDQEAQFRSRETRRRMSRIRMGRAYLDYVFAPNPKIFEVPDETLVCRCECVTAGEIRKAVTEGYTDVNSIKQFTRCGMGHCQGRMCGPALAEITALAAGNAPDAVGTLRIRQPFRPITLKEYCDANTRQE